MTDYRKIIKFGTNSAIISIPKHWLATNKLVPGDSVQVIPEQGGLLIAPGQAKQTKRTKDYFFTITDDDTLIIKRKILHAYLGGCDTITLKGDVASKSKEIRSIIHQLMALEIIEESAHRLQAKCYLNMQDIDLKTLIRKIDGIIKSVFPDTISKIEHPDKFGNLDLAGNISHRDEDINRLCYLITRSVKHFLASPHQHDYSSTTLLNYWDLAQTLEKIGDQLKWLSRLTDKLGPAAAKALVPLLQSFATHYDEIMKAYYKEDNDALNKLATKRKHYIGRMDDYQESHEQDRYTARVVHLVRALFHRIDELTINLKEEQYI